MPDALAEHGWLVERHDDHFAQDTPDDVILRAIASNDWVLLTQDRKIRTRGPERRILLDYGVKTISIASTANLSANSTIQTLLKAKAAIFEAIAYHSAPYIVAVYKDGSLRLLELSDE